MDYIERKDQIDLKGIKDEFNQEKIDAMKNTPVLPQESIVDQASIFAKKSLPGAAALYGGAQVVRNVVPPLLRPIKYNQAAKVSIMIDNFYSPNHKFGGKMVLTVDHFLNNERDEVNNLIKKFGGELGIKPQKIKKISDLNQQDLNKIINLGKQYRLDLTHLNKNSIWKKPKANMGQLMAYAEEDLTSRKLGLAPESKRANAQFKKADRILRAEVQYKNLLDVQRGEAITPEKVQVLRENGLSALKKTTMGNLYNSKEKNPLFNHGKNIGAHGRDLNTTYSGITTTSVSGRDVNALQRAVTKDHMYTMADHVMRNVENLNDKKAIKKFATMRYQSLLDQGAAYNYNGLHNQVKGIDSEVKRFMRSFSYNNKTGIANLHFSPMRKPLPLLGGFNASINFQQYKGKDVISSINKRLGLTGNAKVTTLGGQAAQLSPLKYNKHFLYTDLLDVGKGMRWMQKQPHITYLQSKKAEVAGQVPFNDRLRMLTREKSWKKTLSLVKRIGVKAFRKAFFKF